MVAVIVVPCPEATQSETPCCICFSSHNVSTQMTTTSLSTVLAITVLTITIVAPFFEHHQQHVGIISYQLPRDQTVPFSGVPFWIPLVVNK